MVMFKALAVSLMFSAIIADHDDYNNANNQYQADNLINIANLEKKADRAIQGVRDLRQGRLKKGLWAKIEEIAAQIAEQKIAEAIANFVPPAPPVSSTQEPSIPTTPSPGSEGGWSLLNIPQGNETSGVITSPNYPNNYPSNLDQYYYLSIPYEKHANNGGQYTGISLTFKDFDLEGSLGQASECQYDNLTLTHYNTRKRRDHDSVDYANYPEPGNFTEADYNYGGDHSVRFL